MSLGVDMRLALLKSDKDRSLHLLLLQRTILSTISTYQALQGR